MTKGKLLVKVGHLEYGSKDQMDKLTQILLKEGYYILGTGVLAEKGEKNE